uniref:NADH dehydrogenase subunit 4 n=1 Tax=Diplectrona albofasciata TaxID=2566535 RepID=UPI002238463A|nr:NADH dehydrogenase subunit 4 [Diplectrona albofasciata]UYO79235.1 NADH dehydrogenase subunit 4 [Diplectrona albofasciata]
MLGYLFYLMFSLGLVSSGVWVVYWSLALMVSMFMFNTVNLFVFSSVSMGMGVDVISFGLIILSGWVSLLMFKASSKIFYGFSMSSVLMIFNNLSMLIMLFLTFSSASIINFYIFFEGSMIFVLMLIVGWGYQPERVQAGVYMIFYTLFVSLPMLMGIMFIYDFSKSLMFCMVSSMNLSILYVMMIMAFLVKMPMYAVHLWLPKAHVEAPVAGSMILAGVMLKLGGYGLIRVMKFMIGVSSKFNYIWVIISLVGGVYVSLICFRQIDMKLLIACSSVVHMSLVLGGIMTLNFWGISGSFILMIGHGLCSSGLFVLVNLVYERLGSRSLMFNKGLINLMPGLTLWWFLMVSSNMASPLSINLLGEISLLISLVGWSSSLIFILSLISFFSAGYSLFLFSFSQHGKVLKSSFSLMLVNSREYLLLFLHWFPLNALFMSMDLLNLCI